MAKARNFEVAVESDLCSGCGLCEEIAPAVFTHEFDGISHVRKPDGTESEPMEYVAVDTKIAGKVIEAALECPGEIIFVQIPDPESR